MSAGKKKKVIKDPIWNLFTDNFMHDDTAEERKKEIIIIIIILNS